MMKTAGEQLVTLLEKYGVELVFGIPGTHSIELYRGLESSSIRHISPRHEQGGGFMADGYARVSGKPGVCFVITGPGVTNLSTPMGEAYMDSVPMLVISPVNDPDPDAINRGRLHEITSQEAVTRPISGFSATVQSADEIPGRIAEAFNLFNCDRPRPVHINIPLSVIPEIITQNNLESWQFTIPNNPPVASDTDISSALDLIRQSTNPVMVVGGGTTTNPNTILDLGRKIPCPILTTVAARGVVPGNHALHVGAQLRVPYVQDILQNSDLALFLGTEFAQTDHWNDELVLPENQIWINLCDTALDTRKNALTIQADCFDAAARLSSAIDVPSKQRVVQVEQFCESARKDHKSAFTKKEAMHWSVLETIMANIDNQVTITSDMTQIAYTAVDYLPLSRPNQWLHPTGYGTLGYALPAGIGAALANESNPVLVIVGDAGLQYTMQEMTLASELNLKIVVLLWNNDALQQICDDMDNAGIARIGIFQKNPDFITLAQACGWKAWECTGLGQLGNDLQKALDTTGPVLIKLNEDSI